MADKWSNGVITNAGISMLGEVMSGGELIISRAALGGGIVNVAALMAQTALTQPLAVPVVIAQKKLVEGKGVDVRIQIRNTGVSAAQVMKQVGILAKIGADGEEKLFAIMQDDVGDEIPSAVSYPDFMLEFTSAVTVSNTGNITVSVSGSAVVTREDLEAALDETNSEISELLEGKADKSYVNSGLAGKADKSDVPTKVSDLVNDSGFITSADGGSADSVNSANHKARLYEDPEGGNLRLESPNGAMSMEMDMYDNKSLRMYFEKDGELVFPFLYNSIYNNFEIPKLNGARITSVGARRGYTTSAMADVITYGERVVHKQSSDASYIGWTTTADGWFAPIFVSKTVEGTRYAMNGNECVYSVKGEKCGSFVYHGETYYACWNNPASLINPLVSTSALYVALSGDDYISACKTLINICEGLHATGGNADTLGNRPPEDFANTCNASLDQYLSGKSGDIRALAHLLPPGGFSADTSLFANVTFPISGTILLTWTRSSYRANGNIYLYGVLTVRPLASTGDTYICSVYNTSLYTDWQRLSDGGNAASVNGVSVQSNAQAVGLHQMFVGTADPASVTIPAGAWYGRHS